MIRSSSHFAFGGKGAFPLLLAGLGSFVLLIVLSISGFASQPPEEELKKVEDLFGDFGVKEKGEKGAEEKKPEERKPEDKKTNEKKLDEKNSDEKNSKEEKKPDAEKKPEGDAKVNKAQEALRSKRISVDVDELTLKEALAAISKEAEIEIVLDEEVLQGLAITADTKISAVLPKSMLLRSALKVVLERHGLKAVVEGESIRIAQNENGVAAAPMRIEAAQVEQSDEQLTSALKVELAFLRRACSFTDADEPKLAAFDKKWLKKNSKVAASRVINGNMVAGSSNTLRTSIEKALLKELEGVLTEEQKANYSKEREARTKFERDTQLNSIVLLLDQHLRLRDDQKQALREGLAKSYRDESDMRTYLMNSNYLPQLPDAVILKHLDNDQKEIYRSIQKVTFGMGGQEAAVAIEK